MPFVSKINPKRKHPFVLVESPYSGDIERNVTYAQRAMRFLRSMDMVVFVSHLLWTQCHLAERHYAPDNSEKYRTPNCGREKALEHLEDIRRECDKVYFFEDYGWSSGMKAGLEHCKKENIPYEILTIGKKDSDHHRKPAMAPK